MTTLRRTHETAAPLARLLSLVPIVEPDLREVFLGEWEGGALRARAAAGDPIFEEIFREERWDVIPGAEPHDDFDSRTARGLQRIVDAHPDGRVVVGRARRRDRAAVAPRHRIAAVRVLGLRQRVDQRDRGHARSVGAAALQRHQPPRLIGERADERFGVRPEPARSATASGPRSSQ